ncbi:hypothetical protein DDW07_02895 [Acidilobus sp. SCGC AC-742_E15]|jgi:hypothetical protein|nr:hypothetical protein DDW07_02895 [Acidilobus sp. SCGC AC-742_E15]
MLRPIPDKPALVLGGRERWLVIADLHLGIVDFPDESVINSVSSLLAMGFDGVLILGDAKHDIGLRNREKKEVEILKERILDQGIDEENIILVRGNHDGGLDVVRMEPSSGFVMDKIGFFHGHAKPSEDVLQSKYIVFAHIHPAVYIKDEIGGTKRRVWLEGKWDERKVVVMPAFNELCPSVALNMEKRILRRYRNLEDFNAVMLDGTLVGRLGDLL